VDALALGGDEGRGKLRKASGSRKQASIRGYPNGATRLADGQALLPEFIGQKEPTRGSETSQYPEEEKATAIPSVAASESGTAQTQELAPGGCRAGNVGSQRRAEQDWNVRP
jgi:hypothetical protein